ncbi:MAG: AzlD domain-containing protein [Atopobiaceae bacterium]|jgi:branched-subunit amino acid transport protein|nr:AzlD domain-containing protein [Atopobiaceae bacterium]MCH4180139.1 AzlD domain-containing protein [Atopobiaceae bacterium]MCH4213809.1 AzlD domain-containing protein [Atopobiaceae bacterium]MCH4229804.1 AzlD domain-containing protein [Atopobiaceae bacterium]MCH4275728.1 AzlD domain-containing protein [Atopobiaceae bacterium]
MSASELLGLYGCVLVVILACRCVPLLALRGRALSPRVSEALGLIPAAAFAALVANDLLTPGMFDAGLWPAALPLVAAGIVVVVALRTRSLLWCAVVGVVAYMALMAL